MEDKRASSEVTKKKPLPQVPQRKSESVANNSPNLNLAAPNANLNPIDESTKLYYARARALSSAANNNNVLAQDMFNIIQIALTGLQLDPQQRQEMIDWLKRKTPFHLNLTHSVHTIKNISSYCNKFLTTNDRFAKIIKCQSVIRGYLERKRIRSLYMKENQDKLGQRAEIFRVLMNEEIKYLKSMQHIIMDYVMVLKTKKKGQILSAEEIGALFGNIEEIEQIEFAFVQKMKGLCNKPKLFGIGQLFLDLVPNLNIYGDYILNFRFSDATFIRCVSKDKFLQFMKEKEANSELNLSLRQLLGTPLNHLPKYAYFIDAMLKETPDEDAEYDKLMDSYAIMTQVYWFIQDCFAQSKSFAKLLEIQRRVSGGNSSLIPRMGRVLVREGDLRIVYGSSKKKARGRCYLLNDVYLLCRYEKGSVKRLKFLAMLPVQQTAMQSDLQNSEHAIRLFSGNSTYVLIFEDKETKESWYRSIYENASTRAKKRPSAIFPSKSLPDWLDEDLPADGIPIILKKSVQALLKKGATYEVVTNVRNSMNPTKLNLIQERYAKEGEECDFSSESSADLAGILVSFFQDLDKPIFPLEAYNDLVKCKVGEERSMAKAKQLIARLPWESKRIVKYLIDFLRILCNNSASLKLPSPNQSVSEPDRPSIATGQYVPDQSSTSPQKSAGWTKPVTPSISTTPAINSTSINSNASGTTLSTSPRSGSNLSPRLTTTTSNPPKVTFNSVSPKLGNPTSISGTSPRIGAHSVSTANNNSLKDSRGRNSTATPAPINSTPSIPIAKKGNVSGVSPRVSTLKHSASGSVVGSAPNPSPMGANTTDDDSSTDEEEFIMVDKREKADDDLDSTSTPSADSFILAEPTADIVQHIKESELSIKQKIGKVSVTFAPLLLNVNETNHWAPQALLLELKNMVKLYHFVANLIENGDIIFAEEPTKSIVFQNLHQEFAPPNMELKPVRK